MDAPPIALASEMEEAFKQVGAWGKFILLCEAAFAAARRDAGVILQIAGLSFARSGLKIHAVNRFLRGQSSLNLGVDDETAVENVSQQVQGSAHSAQTWLKRVAHDVIDPMWYGLLKQGFPPAVAIMGMLDKNENKAAQDVAQQLADNAEAVLDEEVLRID